MTSYAAADVRYLLPLAQRLLQRQQQAIVALASLQSALSRHGSSYLQLQPHMLFSYSPLLWPQQLEGAGGQLHKFEMVLDAQHVPRFQLYMSAADGDASADDTAGAAAGACNAAGAAAQAAQNVAASGVQQGRLLGVQQHDKEREKQQEEQEQQRHLLECQHEAQPGQQPAEEPSSEQQQEQAQAEQEKEHEQADQQQPPQQSKQQQEQDDDFCPDQLQLQLQQSDVEQGEDAEVVGDLDEAACSMLDLLPARLAEHLADYRSASKHPALTEIALDQGGSICLSFADESPQQHLRLDDVSMEEALQRLTAVHRGREGPCGSMEGAVCGLQEEDWAGLVELGLAPFACSGGLEAAILAGDAPGSNAAEASPDPFGANNCMGVPGQLHRIAAIRDTEGRVIGLTCRIGRATTGVARLMEDVLAGMSRSIHSSAPSSLLLLGRRGVGKTTLLRDITRLLSAHPDQGGFDLRVVVVDTHKEIAGGTAEKHVSIGAARRMMVPDRDMQHQVLLEAMQNHAPDVIVIDDISTKQDIDAAWAISERGVLLVASVQRSTLQALLKDAKLRDLLGGVADHSTTARSRVSTGRLERAGPALFTKLLELQDRNKWRLHTDVEESIDLLLRSKQPHTQMRSYDHNRRMLVQFDTKLAAERAMAAAAGQGTAGAAAQAEVAPMVVWAGRGPPGAQLERPFTGAWVVDLLLASAHKAIANGF